VRVCVVCIVYMRGDIQYDRMNQIIIKQDFDF